MDGYLYKRDDRNGPSGLRIDETPGNVVKGHGAVRFYDGEQRKTMRKTELGYL